MYGAGIPRLSRTMDVSMQEAGKFKKEFNAAFPEVETWMKKVHALPGFAHGRKCWLVHVYSKKVFKVSNVF